MFRPCNPSYARIQESKTHILYVCFFEGENLNVPNLGNTHFVNWASDSFSHSI